MPQMKSQHWLFGLLGVISLSSVLYTVFIGLEPTAERKVESQHSIDSLTADMKRLMQSITNWQAFCEDPYAYLKSASSHGSFAISVRDQWTAEEVATKSRITRDAITRCMKDKNAAHGAQFRLCLSVKEYGIPKDDESWFDDQNLLEMNVEFRERGSKLLADCKSFAGKRVEVQSYFSAYTDHSARRKAGRVSGGVRLPLESASF